MSRRPAILFVCLGNICRSPMAEGAFRRAAQSAGLDLTIDSAGTGDYHIGRPPDPRAIEEATRHGVDIRDLRGRQVGESDFRDFTHIFALDIQNFADLETIRPQDGYAELALLLDSVPGRRGQSVADPYQGGADHFEQVWRDVESAAASLVERFS